jgi:hypothetical protein
MTRLQNKLSFGVMAVLVFILLNFVFCSDVRISAPEEDLSFGWLAFHRRGLTWSFEHFYFGRLVLDIFLAIALTWGLEKMLRHRMA